MSSYGFIITRHVNSEKTNKYWNHAVRSIRRFYPFRKIVIIDDNSNQAFVREEYDYKNIQIVKSEYPGRGELLPYYYFYKNKYFDNAVILHDSVFFHKRIHFEKLNNLPLENLIVEYYNKDWKRVELDDTQIWNLINFLEKEIDNSLPFAFFDFECEIDFKIECKQNSIEYFFQSSPIQIDLDRII